VARHVTQRGNNRQHVFFVADDRRAYPYEIWRRFPNYRKGRPADAGNMGSVPNGIFLIAEDVNRQLNE
jgi:hypothetical protein